MSNEAPIIVEQTFSTSVDKVWRAITDEDQMRQWFFENIPEFKPEVGFETQFNVETPEREFLHQWKIIDVDPGKKIVYDWQYKGYPGQGKVTFALSEVEDGTKL